MIRHTIALHAKPPFRLDLTVSALRRREGNAIDRWNGQQYDRIIVIQNRPVRLAVTQRADTVTPTLDVTVESRERFGSRGIEEIEHLVRTMLGLDTDLDPFYELADSQELLQPLVERFSGVKPPQFPSLFEALVNAVACQRVTLDLGILLLNRLSERLGAHLVDRGRSMHAFPAPNDLTEVPEESFKELGFSRQKARAIKELALGVSSGRLDLAGLDGVANDEAVGHLSSIRGIGRWSAEYVLLRGNGKARHIPSRRHRRPE